MADSKRQRRAKHSHPRGHAKAGQKRRHEGARPQAVAAPVPWRQRVSDTWFADRSQPAERWQYLWPLLGAAFAARAFVALWGDFALHPDEIMQYLEPAHRAVFGNGVLFWEFVYGARTWLVPGAVAGVLKALDSIGLGQPAFYIPAVKLFFCLLSLLIPWGMYRFMQLAAGEQAARLALIFGCFWYELVVFAHKPFTEFVSAAIFMTALALSMGRRKDRLFFAGLLTALAGAVRPQYAPLALLLLIFRSVSLRTTGGLVSLWAGVALVVVVVGVVGWRTWGAPFHSYLVNFFVNAEINAMRAGESSRWLVLGQLLAASGGGAVAAFAAAAFKGRRIGWRLFILLLGAVLVLLHLLPEHREYRFFYLIIPLWLMLMADWLSSRFGRTDRLYALVARYGTVVVLVFGSLALLNVFPWQSWIHKAFSNEGAVRYLRDQPRIFEAMSFLAKQEDVRGVLDASSRASYVRGGGYYYLHHDVPFYSIAAWGEANRRRPDTPPEALVSHIIANRDVQVDNFEPLQHFGDLVILRRRDNDQAVIAWRTHVADQSPLQLFSRAAERHIGRLHDAPLLGLFMADLRRDKASPPLLEFADDPGMPQKPGGGEK